MALSPAEAQALLARVNRPGIPDQWGYDPAKGLFFTIGYQGARQYQSTGPDGSVQAPKPAGGGGLVHGAMEWDTKEGKWKSPIDIGKVASWGVGAGLGAGVADAAGLFGGGAAAGAGSGSVAGDVAGVNAKLAGAGVGGWAPEVAGGAGLGADLLKKLTSGQGVAGLASLIPMLMAANSGGGAGSGTGTGDFAQMPQLNSLLDMSVNRAQRTDPLHQAVTQLAMSRLPTNVQR